MSQNIMWWGVVGQKVQGHFYIRFQSAPGCSP